MSGRLPSDIPVGPSRVYKDQGWAGWGDWLGTGAIANFLIKYRPFAQARSFVWKLKLRNVYEWRDFTKSGHLPSDIPATPDRTYRDKGWAGYSDWLGNGRPPRRKIRAKRKSSHDED